MHVTFILFFLLNAVNVEAEPIRGIVASDAGAGAYEAFPDVCMTEEGELICVFYAGYDHVSIPDDRLPNGARICLTRSTDNGLTWSDPVKAVDTPIDDRDPSITVLPDGSLIMTFMTYDPDRVAGTHQCFVTRSSDNGRTWSDAEPLPSPFTQLEAISSPVRILADGRLVACPYGNNIGDPRRYKQASVIESHDNGFTWDVLAEITSEEYVLLEPDIIEFPDGRLLVMMRDVMTWSESTDGGQTWSDPKELGIAGHCPYLLLTSEGLLLCGIRTVEYTADDERIMHTGILWSRDEGRTWNGPHIIDDCVGAYPSMVEMPDGRIFCVYYSEGEGSDIRFLLFAPETLTSYDIH